MVWRTCSTPTPTTRPSEPCWRPSPSLTLTRHIRAYFAASVAAANTNALVGAPGKDSGSGEIYVFGGDPTQLTFGSLLHKIVNPIPQPGAEFGAGLSGLAGDVIVAPFDNTAGIGAGIVYLFDVSSGTQLTAIVNPRPAASTGFGSSVASVGSNS